MDIRGLLSTAPKTHAKIEWLKAVVASDLIFINVLAFVMGKLRQ